MASNFGLGVERPVVVAVRKEATGQPSQSGASSVPVISTVERTTGGTCASALSRAQIRTQAAKTHRRHRGINAATARTNWMRGLGIEESITDGEQAAYLQALAAGRAPKTRGQ